ncbi:substrate-binding domain-containing protein [Roseovarius sp. SCSIO 43702]|uniref:substrate-binding domain-containing protein n=1 Tax=Roseovarius sp. SCSIO 43702 TaxID=2823043 RepID=UPI001C73DFB0|nr:substrate-binding domain-containing protein [Roseovarius sp. SCSIO 43702]QYX57039.1 substrate-binding domain-containing protein [Roseovarius sp. SCSIO 43702]
MIRFCAAIFAALLFAGIGSGSSAQDVTLTSRDGAVEIHGDLLGYDGEFYRVDTVYGELTVDGTGVLCSGPGCPDLANFVAEIRFSGAPVVGRLLLPALLEAFGEKEGYDIRADEGTETRRVTYALVEKDSGKTQGRFHIHLSNSDEGFADLLADEADIVMTLREVREAEARRAEEAGIGDLTDRRRSRVLALDALVPLVTDDNPVATMTTPRLARVLSGKITNWNELGGPDAPIAVHLLSAATGLGQATEDLILKGDEKEFSPDAIRHNSTRDLVDAVSRDPFAIGLGSRSDVGTLREVPLAGECGFAISASRRGVKTEDYPLTAPIFLYSPARRFPRLVREFLAFTGTPAAQLVIRRAGFVDQLPEEIPVDEQGDRFANAVLRAGDEVSLEDLQQMVRVLTPLKRLTTTFRFEAGSSRLDAQSRSNVTQLAQALEGGLYDTRRLVFIGFGDGEGPAGINRQIAHKRAMAVRAAVIAAAETANLDRFILETRAFGEAMPMACDDSAWGRQANRRVEVWLR